MALPRVSFLSVQFGLLIACTTVLSAQLNRGAIEGTVTDPQGAALSGVDVTITAVATNVMTNTETNSSGYYSGGFSTWHLPCAFRNKGICFSSRNSHRGACCASNTLKF